MAMDDLEAAAREAVGRVQTLLENTGEAEKECRTALAYVEALGQQLEQDRTALEQAVEELASTSDAAEAHVSQHAVGAAGALGVLTTALRQAGEDGEADLDAEAAALVNVSTLLSELGPRVREVADAAEAASRAALERAQAIAQTLEDVVDKIQQVVGVEYVSLVNETKAQLETATDEVLKFMNVTCIGELDKRQGEWRTNLQTVRELLDTSCDRVEQHTQEVTVHTAGTWSRQVDDEIAAIETEARTAIEALESLTSLVDNKEGQVQVASEMVVEGLDQATKGAAVVEGELHNVRGRWGTFGITT